MNMKEKGRTDFYPQYKKLVKTLPEKTIAETAEYTAFAQRYPHLAESIRLRSDMKRLQKTMNLTKDHSAKRKINAEMNKIKTALKRKNISARIHGESSVATQYRVHFAVDTLREHIQYLVTRSFNVLKRTRRTSQRRLNRLVHKRLPPSIFDLNSLDVAEKHVSIIEWVRNRRKQT